MNSECSALLWEEIKKKWKADGEDTDLFVRAFSLMRILKYRGPAYLLGAFLIQMIQKVRLFDMWSSCWSKVDNVDLLAQRRVLMNWIHIISSLSFLCLYNKGFVSFGCQACCDMMYHVICLVTFSHAYVFQTYAGISFDDFFYDQIFASLRSIRM